MSSLRSQKQKSDNFLQILNVFQKSVQIVKLSKIGKIVKNCQKLSNLSKVSKIVTIVKICKNFQNMLKFSNKCQNGKKSQYFSQVITLIKCLKVTGHSMCSKIKSGSVTQWVSEWVSDQWQGHRLSCLWTAKNTKQHPLPNQNCKNVPNCPFSRC